MKKREGGWERERKGERGRVRENARTFSRCRIGRHDGRREKSDASACARDRARRPMNNRRPLATGKMASLTAVWAKRLFVDRKKQFWNPILWHFIFADVEIFSAARIEADQAIIFPEVHQARGLRYQAQRRLRGVSGWRYLPPAFRHRLTTNFLK